MKYEIADCGTDNDQHIRTLEVIEADSDAAAGEYLSQQYGVEQPNRDEPGYVSGIGHGGVDFRAMRVSEDGSPA